MKEVHKSLFNTSLKSMLNSFYIYIKLHFIKYLYGFEVIYFYKIIFCYTKVLNIIYIMFQQSYEHRNFFILKQKILNFKVWISISVQILV